MRAKFNRNTCGLKERKRISRTNSRFECVECLTFLLPKLDFLVLLFSLHFIKMKKVLLRDARGVLSAAYPVHGVSCRGGGGYPVLSSGYPCPVGVLPLLYDLTWIPLPLAAGLMGYPQLATDMMGVPPGKDRDQRLGHLPVDRQTDRRL